MPRFPKHTVRLALALILAFATPARATEWLPERSLTITPTIPGGEPVGKIDVPDVPDAPEPGAALLIASAAFLTGRRGRG